MANAKSPTDNGLGNVLRVGAAVALVALALAGCRQNEQGRVLWYQAGVFKGHNPDKPLSAADLAQIRERTMNQSGGGIGGGSMGISGASGANVRLPADVRPPASQSK